MQRRNVLAYSGTALLPLVAGCLGSAAESDDGATSDTDGSARSAGNNNRTGSSGNDDLDDTDANGDRSASVPYVDTTEEAITLAFGEAAATSFGISYTVRELELMESYDRESGSEEIAPDSTQYARIQAAVHNEYDGRVRAPLVTEWQLVHDTSQYETDVYGYTNRYDGGVLQPGIIREGAIMYEVPAILTREDLTAVLWRSGRDPSGRAYEMTVRWSADGA